MTTVLAPATQSADPEIDQLERAVSYTLSDAIRSGSKNTTQAHGWGQNNTACALAAAALDARSRGYLDE